MLSASRYAALPSLPIFVVVGTSALGLAACGNAPPPVIASASASPPAADPAPEASPTVAAAPPVTREMATPFTWEQIRDASLPGREWVWRIERPGQPIFAGRTRILETTADGARIETTMLTASLTPIDETVLVTLVSWQELRDRELFPVQGTDVGEQVVDVPAGRFRCRSHRVTDPSTGDETTSFYPLDAPGAPVLVYTEHGGQRVMTSTLVRYLPGNAPGAPLLAAGSRACRIDLDCVLATESRCDPCACPQVYSHARTAEPRPAPRCRRNLEGCPRGGMCGGLSSPDAWFPTCRAGRCEAAPRVPTNP